MTHRTLTLILLFLALPAAAQEPAPIPWANKFFAGKVAAPPPVILQDFGVVPKGTVKTYRFTMTNIYAVPMQVELPKPSCSCVSVIEYTGKMGPMDSGHVDVVFDASRVDGAKIVKLPITFHGQDPTTKKPFFSTAELEIRAYVRTDVAFNPGEFAFGTIAQGKKVSQAVDVTYSGPQPDWKITEVGVRKELFDVDVAPLAVRGARAYRVTLTLKSDAPAGHLNEVVEFKTNEPGNKAVLALAVNGYVQAPLAVVGPKQVRFGGIEVGQKSERQVPVQAAVAFKITGVEGQGDGITVPILPVDPNKAQVIRVVFAPEKPGSVKKKLIVKTDTGKSVELEVEGTGTEPK